MRTADDTGKRARFMTEGNPHSYVARVEEIFGLKWTDAMLNYLRSLQARNERGRASAPSRMLARTPRTGSSA